MNAGLLVSELPTLFDGLERAGFTVTVQSRLAVHDLLLRLTVENSLPSDPDALRRMIGPIVCTSPAEQEQFESLFLQWREQLTELEEPSAQEPPPSQAVVERASEKRSKKGRPILTGCVIATAIALAVWMNERRFEESHPASDFAPLSQLDATSEPRDPAVNPKDDSNDQLDEAKTPPDQAPEPESPPSAPIEPTARDSALPEESSQDPAAGSPAEPELIAETHTTESKPRFGLAAAVTGIGLLFSVLAVCTWWWLSAHWRKRFLVKRSVGHDPELEQLAVQCTSNGRFGNSFWRTAQRFRQHLSRASHRLDMVRTAARTAASGGLFTPVLAEEKVSPSYLMLIDSDGRRDQQTQIIDDLADQLESEGVAVTRYYFRGDPRICRQPGGRARKLAELAASHHSDRLMVFADARSFLDPMTGGVSQWVEAFESWPERALLVAAEADDWTAAEATMSEHFRIAPANSGGLSSLVERFTPDPALSPGIGSDRFPAMLREHPERWLDREAPSQDLLDKLVNQLRQYLGDAGYAWLSACAVYPTLHNRLTLWTGESLTDENNRPLVNDSDLMRLSGLPWLRQGQLPDWLRARLIADLSEQQELAIRNRLDHLFRSVLAKPNADTTLPIARDSGRSRQQHRNRGRMLRDHTFISFMSNPLSVRLPRALGRVLPFHRAWQPLKALSTFVVLASLFAVSAFLSAPAGQATTNSAQPDASLVASREVNDAEHSSSSFTRKLAIAIDSQTWEGESDREVREYFKRTIVDVAEDSHPWLEVVRGVDEADLIVAWDKTAKKAYLVSQHLWQHSNAGTLAYGATVQGTLVSRHLLAGGVWEFSTYGDIRMWLKTTLSDIARSRNLLEVAESHIRKGSPSMIEVELQKLRDTEDLKGSELIEVRLDKAVELEEGDLIGVRLRNRSAYPVLTTLLFIDGDAQTRSVFPTTPNSREHRLEAKGIRGDSMMAFRFRVNTETDGLEHLVAISVRYQSNPPDFTLLGKETGASRDGFNKLLEHLENRFDDLTFNLVTWRIEESLHPVYDKALQMAKSHDVVQEMLGGEIEGTMPDKEATTANTAEIEFFVAGDNSIANVVAKGEKQSGEWKLTALAVEALDGSVIDLLQTELKSGSADGIEAPQPVGSQVSLRARITNSPVVVVGDDVRLSIEIINEGDAEIPSTATIEARYQGAFEPKGFLDTLREPIPPGASKKLELPGIAVQKNGEFTVEVKVYANSSREQLLAETKVKARAFQPPSAPIPTVSNQPQRAAHITVKGPTQTPPGEQAQFKIIVTNTGSKPLDNVSIRNRFDTGLKHVARSRFEYARWQTENYSAEERAKINEALNRPADAPLVSELAGHQPITKSIGKLAAGESRFVALQFYVDRPGKLCQTIQVLEGDLQVASTQHCLNAPNSEWRRETVQSENRLEQRYRQSVPQVQQQALPPGPPSTRPPIGNPPVLPGIPLPDRAQQSKGPVQRTDDTIRIRLNEPKPPLVPPQDREPYVIEFTDDFNFDARLMPALKSWRPFIIIKTDATSQRALSGRIGQWVAAWNEGRSYLKPPKLRGTPSEIVFGPDAARMLGNPLAPRTIAARNAKKQTRVDALKPYNIATNAGSGQPIQIWLYNRFYTQALPENLRQANTLPTIPLPSEQRMVPSTANDLDVQQRPLR